MKHERLKQMRENCTVISLIKNTYVIKEFNWKWNLKNIYVTY